MYGVMVIVFRFDARASQPVFLVLTSQGGSNCTLGQVMGRVCVGAFTLSFYTLYYMTGQ